jgi:hypothetical protein
MNNSFCVPGYLIKEVKSDYKQNKFDNTPEYLNRK